MSGAHGGRTMCVGVAMAVRQAFVQLWAPFAEVLHGNSLQKVHNLSLLPACRFIGSWEF